MTIQQADRVAELSTDTGTGPLFLAGAPVGYRTWTSAFGAGGNTEVYYGIIQDLTGEWEVGLGTFLGASNAMRRDLVLSSSNGGSLTVFPPGDKMVYCTFPAESTLTLRSRRPTDIALTAIGPVVASGTTPILEFDESDQASPLGHYRFWLESGNFIFQNALTANFATYENIWATKSVGDGGTGTFNIFKPVSIGGVFPASTASLKIDATYPGIWFHDSTPAAAPAPQDLMMTAGNGWFRFGVGDAAGTIVTDYFQINPTNDNVQSLVPFNIDLLRGAVAGASVIPLNIKVLANSNAYLRVQDELGNERVALYPSTSDNVVLRNRARTTSTVSYLQLNGDGSGILSAPGGWTLTGGADAANYTIAGGLKHNVGAGYFMIGAYNVSSYGDGSLRTYWDQNNLRWLFYSQATGGAGNQAAGITSLNWSIESGGNLHLYSTAPIIYLHDTDNAGPYGHRFHSNSGYCYIYDLSSAAGALGTVCFQSGADYTRIYGDTYCGYTSGDVYIGSTTNSSIYFRRTSTANALNYLHVPDTHRLAVRGTPSNTVWATISSATGWVAGTSDLRNKDNVEDIPYGLAEVLAVRAVEFDYKADGVHDIGFIAQEMLEVVPEVVVEMPGDPDVEGSFDSYSMRKDALVAVLWRAVQELTAEVRDLRDRLATLEAA